jgi:hypothetical protein
VKSRAGRRTIGIPGPLVKAPHEHRQQQAKERERAGSLWQEGDWVFTQVTGRPVDPLSRQLSRNRVRPLRMPPVPACQRGAGGGT